MRGDGDFALPVPPTTRRETAWRASRLPAYWGDRDGEYAADALPAVLVMLRFYEPVT